MINSSDRAARRVVVTWDLPLRPRLLDHDHLVLVRPNLGGLRGTVRIGRCRTLGVLPCHLEHLPPAGAGGLSTLKPIVNDEVEGHEGQELMFKARAFRLRNVLSTVSLERRPVTGTRNLHVCLARRRPTGSQAAAVRSDGKVRGSSIVIQAPREKDRARTDSSLASTATSPAGSATPNEHSRGSTLQLCREQPSQLGTEARVLSPCLLALRRRLLRLTRTHQREAGARRHPRPHRHRPPPTRRAPLHTALPPPEWAHPLEQGTCACGIITPRRRHLR